MEYDFGNTIASMSQFWNWLENRWGENNKVSRRVWKAMETKAREVGIAKSEERGEKGKRRKEARRKRIEKGEIKEKEE